MLNLDAKALTVLRIKNPLWFNVLSEKWRKRTGYDPVATAVHIAQIERQREFWEFTLMLVVVLWLLMMLISLGTLSVVQKSLTIEIISVLAFSILVSVFVGTVVIQKIALRKIPKKAEIYPADADLFRHYLSNFLDWAVRSPNEMDDSTDMPMLRELAHDVIFKKAVIAARFQREKPKEHLDTWGAEAEKLRQDVIRAHTYLLALSLAHPLFDRYWREAEDFLNAEH